MYIFIWERLDVVSNSWHSEGGLVVVAENLDAARKVTKEHVPDDCDAFRTEPDVTARVELDKPAVYVFPDAGCC